MKVFPFYAAVPVLCSLSLLSGCGGGGCSISGTVVVDGQPVPEGRIALRPVSRSSGSRTQQAVISEGAFQFPASQGVTPGKYDVVITARRKTGKLMPPEEGGNQPVERYEQYLPSRYNTQTMLDADISGDTNDLVYELETGAKPRN